MRLTVKQRLFADEYIKSGNATQAAIKAGYSPKTVRSIGQENLTKPDIKAYIDAKMAEIESNKIATAKEVLEFYTSVMRAEVTETIVVGTGNGAEIVETPPKPSERISAAREIMKRYPLSDPMANEQLRKLKADVRITEAKAKVMEDSGQDIVTALDSIMDKLVGESDKESERKR